MSAAQNTLTVPNVDAMMDLTSTLCRNATARDTNMLRAHKAGLDACECCGKAIKNPATAYMILDAAGEVIGTFGPECGKRAKI